MSFLSNSSFSHKRPFSQISSLRKHTSLSLREIPASEDEEFNKSQKYKKPFEIPIASDDIRSTASSEEPKEILGKSISISY